MNQSDNHLRFLSDISAGSCKIGEYECGNKNCIHHNQTCDSNNDCGDWSDETDCRGM